MATRSRSEVPGGGADRRGVRGRGALQFALLPFFLVVACLQSIRVILRRRPDVVLGMGGFAAFPGGLMASLLNRPLVIHEQNCIAGLANRVLGGLADRVLTGFPGAFETSIGGALGRLFRPPAAPVWAGEATGGLPQSAPSGSHSSKADPGRRGVAA